jgi:hypothetical protein
MVGRCHRGGVYDLDSSYFTPTTQLYGTWRSHCESRGERPVPIQQFTSELSEKRPQLKPARVGKQKISDFCGIRFKGS